MRSDQREENGRAQSQGNGSGSPPSLSLPKGGGAIRDIGEKFSMNPVTGTAALSVPIFTTTSRSDFYPKLSISYDSGSGNGLFGSAGGSPFLLSLERLTKVCLGIRTVKIPMCSSRPNVRLWAQSSFNAGRATTTPSLPVARPSH